MKLGIYRHFRGGLYRAMFTMRDSTNGPKEGQTLVAYLSLTTGKMLSREHDEFHQTNFMDGGELIAGPRFAYVSEDIPWEDRKKI